MAGSESTKRNSGRSRCLEVLMVGPKSFPPVIGGIETHVFELSRRLVERGVSVSMLIPRTRKGTHVERSHGVRVIRVPCIENRYALKLSIMPSIARQLRNGEYDIIHAHDATGGFACALSSEKDRLVYTMHGLAYHPEDWPTPFRQGIKIMQMVVLRRARHLFCTDSGSAEEARRFRQQVEILPNAVDFQAFSDRTSRKPDVFEDGFFNVLFVGRLSRVKGVEVLLDAIRRIDPATRRQMRFVLVGDGPLRDEVSKVARTITEIRHVGTVSHADIVQYFAHAEAYVLPSLAEGLPLSLLEAMAAGLPVIASNVGGISSHVSRDTIKQVTAGDSRELADSIVELKRNPEVRTRLGDKAQKFISENCSWDRVVDRVLDVYERLDVSARAREVNPRLVPSRPE